MRLAFDRNIQHYSIARLIITVAQLEMGVDGLEIAIECARKVMPHALRVIDATTYQSRYLYSIVHKIPDQ